MTGMSLKNRAYQRDAFWDGAAFSFSSKILITICGVTVLTAVLIGGLYHRQIERMMFDREISKLSFEVQSMEAPFQVAFDDLMNDVLILANLPPVQGLIRSLDNDGVDPLDGSTTELWRRRMETIFVSMLKPRAAYVQIRYIGLDDGGRELVRVNSRGSNDIEVVAPENLQQKGEEDYFKAVQDVPLGSVYLSPVNLNREHGKVQMPHVPVIRAAAPVYGQNNDLFGMIVINAAYDKLLRDVVLRLNPDKDLYLVNEQGDFLIYRKDKLDKSFRYSFSHTPDFDEPIINTPLEEPHEHGYVFKTIGGVERVVYYHKLFFDPQDKTRFLSFVSTVPKAQLTANAKSLRIYGFGLAFVLVVVAFLSATFLASLFKTPLKKMVRNIENYDRAGHALRLPVRRRDEIGELACAFQGLTEKLEAMSESERNIRGRLQAIMDSTVEGLITINEKGIVLHYNRACETIFGYKAKDVVGQNVKMLMPTAYRIKHDEYLDRYHRTGERQIIGIGREVQGRRKDGSEFPIDLSVSEVNIQGQRLYSGIVRDITERKKAEDEILRSNEELERFAYVASHDLQEPLRMILNFTTLLQDEYGKKLKGDATQYMAFVTDGAARMQSLVNDLLEYSRVDSGHADLTDVDCAVHIKLALDNLQETIEETKAEIKIGDLPHVRANPVRFVRLMQNLLGNAIKYRAPERDCVVEVRAEDHQDHWVFAVADNGIGMRQEYLDKIFIIFKRLHGKGDYPGTGLGLAICKKIVEGFGGRIWVESKEGQGSTFFFTLPKIDAEAEGEQSDDE